MEQNNPDRLKLSYERIYGPLPIEVIKHEYNLVNERIQELLMQRLVLFEVIQERTENENS